MAEIITPDGWPVARPARGHRPLAAALGLSISLHLALLAGLRFHSPGAAHPLQRPASLTAYLAPAASQHAAVSRRLPGARATTQPRQAPARHRAHPAVAARQSLRHPAPSLHPAPMPRQQPPIEAQARPEAGKVRTPQRAVRPHHPVLRQHMQAANSPAPRQVTQPTPQHERPYPEAAPIHARHTRSRPARPHAPVMTRQSSTYAAAGAPVRALPTPHRQADSYTHARESGRVTEGGGIAAPAAAPPTAMAPGSDIRVLGRGRAVAQPAEPAAEGAANDAGNSAAGELADRPLALLSPVHPAYPLAARRDNIEGAVVVRIWVDAAGNVSNVQVLRASPPGYFESAAIAAVRQWHYAPAMRHGRPVAAVVAGYTLRFRLLDADD